MNAADEPISSDDWQLIPAAVILFPMWLLGLVGLFTLWGLPFLFAMIVLLPLNSALWAFALLRLLPKFFRARLTLRNMLIAVFLLCTEIAGMRALSYWELHRYDFGPGPGAAEGNELPWRRGNIEFTPQSSKESGN